MVDKVLLIVHAVAAGVLVGSSTHLALQALAHLGGRAKPRLLRIYPPVAFGAWVVVVSCGALMYPHYRIDVREHVLDVRAVWASVLFDVKENLAVLVGPLLAGAWWLAGAHEGMDAGQRRWFALSCIGASAVVWSNAISGLLVTSVYSV